MIVKSAVLFSGGKDSTLVLSHALESSDVKCLISVVSKNPESFMFHTPNINLVKKQAKCIGIPLILQKTEGIKEKELWDLEKAMLKAKTSYNVERIYTGALASKYQASRIGLLCEKLCLECFNPLWQRNQFGVLAELQERKIHSIVVGVFAQGLEGFLGRKIDSSFVRDIKPVVEKYSINPAGEGGEFESFVLDAPFFKQKLEIMKSHVLKDRQGGKVLKIEKIKAVKKDPPRVSKLLN